MASATRDTVECFPIGGGIKENHKSYDTYGAHDCGDVVFSKQTTPEMSALRKHFSQTKDFPKRYLGIVKKITACKDPVTEEVYHQDALDIQNDIEILERGDQILVKNTRFCREFIFEEWSNKVFHKFEMRSGIYSFLRQDFIDKLSAEDKRALGMN